MSLSSLYSFKSLISERGYTGHEQMDSVGLIHMNGRVHDPVIEWFVSADLAGDVAVHSGTVVLARTRRP